ncbi:MAG: decarboxylating 6-phosphogluconate dehydrogenase [Chromatiales bacterium]|jgi:6-phosphogluconate dehydrogenase|nr:decarboxylating 6-phosphogluconate dehydrogenase [Chromatiales bacterium]
MKLGMIGLGKMGGNMVRRLRRAGIEVVGYSPDEESRQQLADEVGMVPAPNVTGTVKRLTGPRIVWVMVPAGSATDKVIKELEGRLENGDIVIDGGNSSYKDTQRRGAMLAQSGIGLVDVGTSGGIWGLENGYCLMVGGEKNHVQQIEPILQALAPENGWLHVGPRGSGHYVKMIHNAIEYGMMQAYAEGFALLHGKKDYAFDTAAIAEVWRHGSVVRSWLLDLSAEILQKNGRLEGVGEVVSDSGEGRWAAAEAISQGVPAPVLSMALQMRFASQQEGSYSNRMLNVMRNAFGGHPIDPKKAGEGR